MPIYSASSSGGSSAGTGTSAARRLLTIMPIDAVKSVTSMPNFDLSSQYWHNARRHNGAGGVNGSQLAYDVDMVAGAWTFVLLHDEGADRGIVEVALDGTVVATVDMYAGTATNNIRSERVGIVVANAGTKALTLTVNGQNASSTGFFFSFQGFSAARTGA